MFRTFAGLLHWTILQHTCVCSQQQLVGQPSFDLSCNTCGGHTCVPAAIPMTLVHNLTSLLLQHICVCAQRSSWFAKVVECSELSLDFFFGLFCSTHVCVHSSNWSANPQLTPLVQHMRVCAHSTNRSAKAFYIMKGFN